MEPGVWSAFFAASLVLALAPGPDNLFVLVQSASLGARAGLWVGAGLLTGILMQTLAAALGVAAVVADVVVSMTIDLVKQKRIQPIIMLAAAFILIAVLDVSIVAVIILSALVGYASSVWNRRHQHDLS